MTFCRSISTLICLIFLFKKDDDLISTVEESALLQRKYEKYLDMVIVNEDFDITFRKVVEALDALSHEHQWVSHYTIFDLEMHFVKSSTKFHNFCIPT